MMCHYVTSLCFVALGLVLMVNCDLDVRPSVIGNLIKPGTVLDFAFVAKNGKLLCLERPDTGIWKTQWSPISSSGGPKGILSNPSVSYNPKNNATKVFILGSDGQVWTSEQSTGPSVDCSTFSPTVKLALPDISFESNATVIGQDNINVLQKGDKLYIFVRSYSHKPQLLYTVFDGVNYTAWFNVGGHLYSDAAVVLNPFSNYFEAFAFGKSGKLKRTWMNDDQGWADWRVCGDSQPKLVPTHRPSAHSMSPTIFNGMTEVFALGTDGKLHHIWQTTCDHVKNPWGYCTWGLWYSIGTTAPTALSTINSFGAGNNVHLGNEVFSMDNKGSLWHLWQLQRDDSWHGWEMAGHIQGYPAVAVQSLPFFRNSLGGWWEAFILTSNDKLMEITQNRSLSSSATKVNYGSSLTVSWEVPVDEATHMDWVGIYPHGMDNQKYVDYRYVQGTQNPLKDAMPVGKVSMQSFLTDGSYDVRYLVNRKFISVMQTSVTYLNASTQADWVLLYQGIARGLGKQDTNFTACVKDGDVTVQTFKDAFDAFENREVFKALQKLGQALGDVKTTLQQCGETKIVERLTKFVKDLISCTESDCASFIIDIVEEIVILYEDIYEIFGDIRAATNSLNIIKAYEQAGLCIGRVVAACISLPS